MRNKELVRKIILIVESIVDLFYPYLLLINFEYHKDYRFKVPVAEGFKALRIFRFVCLSCNYSSRNIDHSWQYKLLQVRFVQRPMLLLN